MFGVGRESRICSTSHAADWLADEKTQLTPSYLRRNEPSSSPQLCNRWNPLTVPPDRSSSAPALWPTAGYPPALPQSGPLQYLMRRDPVHSRAFHRHRYYVSRQQPGRHPFQLWRGRSERFHLPSRPTQLRRTHLMLLASQIDPRYVGSNHWEPFAFHMAVRLVGFSTIF